MATHRRSNEAGASRSTTAERFGYSVVLACAVASAYERVWDFPHTG